MPVIDNQHNESPIKFRCLSKWSLWNGFVTGELLVSSKSLAIPRSSAESAANWNKNAEKAKLSETFDISWTFVCNRFVGLSDIFGALPVGAAPITSSFSI